MTHELSAFASTSPAGGETCPVCLRRLKKCRLGKPENCDHYFCFTCIHEWAKNVNTCPVDRMKFNFIEVYSSLRGKLLKREYIPDNNMIEVSFDPNDVTYCEICHDCTREDCLLLCDGCDRGFHTDCLSPPLDEIPGGDWYCNMCIPIIHEQYDPTLVLETDISMGSNSESDSSINSDSDSNSKCEEDINVCSDDESVVELRRTRNRNGIVRIDDSSESSNEEEEGSSEMSSEDDLAVPRQRPTVTLASTSSDEVDLTIDEGSRGVSAESDGQLSRSKTTVQSDSQHSSEESESDLDVVSLPVGKRRRKCVKAQRIDSDSPENDSDSKEVSSVSTGSNLGGVAEGVAPTEANIVAWKSIAVPLTRLKWKIPRKRSDTTTSANEDKDEDVPVNLAGNSNEASVKHEERDEKAGKNGETSLIPSGYVILDDVIKTSSSNTTRLGSGTTSAKHSRDRAVKNEPESDVASDEKGAKSGRGMEIPSLSTRERSSEWNRRKRRRSQRNKSDVQTASSNTWFDSRGYEGAHGSRGGQRRPEPRLQEMAPSSLPIYDRYSQPSLSSWAGVDPTTPSFNYVENQILPTSLLPRQTAMYNMYAGLPTTTATRHVDVFPDSAHQRQTPPPPMRRNSESFDLPGPSGVSRFGPHRSSSPSTQPYRSRGPSTNFPGTSAGTRFGTYPRASPRPSSSAGAKRRRKQKRKRKSRLVLTVTKRSPSRRKEPQSQNAAKRKAAKKRRLKRRRDERNQRKANGQEVTPRKSRFPSRESASDPTYSPRRWNQNLDKSSEGRMTRARTAATNTPRRQAMREAVRESYRHNNREEGLRFAREILAKQGRISSTPCHDGWGLSVTTPTGTPSSIQATPQSGYVDEKYSSSQLYHLRVSIPETPPSTMSSRCGIRTRPESNSDSIMGTGSPNREQEEECCQGVMDELKRRSIPSRRTLNPVLEPSPPKEEQLLERNPAEPDREGRKRSRLGSSDLIHQLCQNLDDLQNRNNIIQRDGSIIPIKEDIFSSPSSLPVDPLISLTSPATPSSPSMASSVSSGTTPHNYSAHHHTHNHQSLRRHPIRPQGFDSTLTFRQNNSRSVTTTSESAVAMEMTPKENRHTPQKFSEFVSRQSSTACVEDRYDNGTSFEREDVSSTVFVGSSHFEGAHRRLNMDQYNSDEGRVSELPATTVSVPESPNRITSTSQTHPSTPSEHEDPKAYVKRLLKQQYHLGNITSHQYSRILERATRKVEQGQMKTKMVDKPRIKRLVSEYVKAYVSANSEPQVS